MTSYMWCLFAILMESSEGLVAPSDWVETFGEVGRCLDARADEVGEHALPGAALARFPVRGLVLEGRQPCQSAATDGDAIQLSVSFFGAASPPVGTACRRPSCLSGLAGAAERIGRGTCHQSASAAGDLARLGSQLAAPESARRSEESFLSKVAAKIRMATAGPVERPWVLPSNLPP